MTDSTPAPWYDDGYRIHAPTEDEDKRNGRVIVEYKHVDHFNNPDAALMTAAPELLEALKAIIGCFDIGTSSYGFVTQKELRQGSAAIAKARGQS